MTTVYGDLVYPQAVGRRPRDFRFVTWYTRCIAELASTDLEVRKYYQRALILQAGMYSLFRPNIFAKAMAYGARRPFVPLDQRANTASMPVMQISRIRLSDKTSRLHTRHAAPPRAVRRTRP